MRLGLGLALTQHRGASGYAGPLDSLNASVISAIKFLGGGRRFLSSYTGPLLRVRRSSDNAELDISAGSDGWLDWDAANTFKGAGSLYVTTLYDQGAACCDLVQTTAAAQPMLTQQGSTNRSTLVFDGTDDHMMTASAFAWGATDVTTVLAGQRYASPAQIMRFCDFGSITTTTLNSHSIYSRSTSGIQDFKIASAGNATQRAVNMTAPATGTDVVVSHRASTTAPLCRGFIDGVQLVTNASSQGGGNYGTKKFGIACQTETPGQFSSVHIQGVFTTGYLVDQASADWTTLHTVFGALQGRTL